MTNNHSLAKRALLTASIALVAITWVAAVAESPAAQQPVRPAEPPTPRPPVQEPRSISELGAFSWLSQRALLAQYCITCHNETLETGGLALDTLRQGGYEPVVVPD